MSWTSRNEFDRKLIELIRGYPILYDLRKRKRHDRLRIQRIWERIASDMNWDLCECQTRWHNIRDSYIKMHRLKEENRAPIKSKYFASHLKFMETLLKHKQSPEKVTEKLQTSTGSKYNNENDESENIDIIGVNNEYSKMLNCEVVLLEDVGNLVTTPEKINQYGCPKYKTLKVSETPTSISNGHEEERLQIKTPEKINQTESPKYKKLKVSRTSTGISNGHDEEQLQIVPRSPIKKSVQIIPKSTEETDALNTVNPVFTFFKSMAQIVAQFPPCYIAEARLRICQCVGEMEVRALSERKKSLSSDY